MKQHERKNMTLEEIKNRVKEISDMAGDSEAAHSMEDSLMRDFISHVSAVADKELADMACEVMLTENIAFSRWCA